MNSIINILLQYGFHDTKISSIESDNNELVLKFNDGLYHLDKNGKETILSSPLKLIIKINQRYTPINSIIEIREIGEKLKYIDFKEFKKEPFEIMMVYFSNFDNTLLFDGGVGDKQILFSIEGIDEIFIYDNDKIVKKP